VGSLTLFCGDREVGEELAQEALARALAAWDRVAEMACPEAWVYKTGLNLARDGIRRRRIERRMHQRLAATAREVTLPDTPTALAVRGAVLALPPRQRAAILARFYAGLGVEESAQVLGCAPGTVKALVHQAVRRLRAAGLMDDEEVIDVAPG
jgi:RNA polymerase sigma factor (sigma-70 family)